MTGRVRFHGCDLPSDSLILPTPRGNRTGSPVRSCEPIMPDGRCSAHFRESASASIPAATRTTCVNRSIETTRTSCSTRSTPRARTTHITPRAPLRAHLRRPRDSHAACSRTRARCRPSYALVFVSTAIPSARSRPSRRLPCHGNECRSRHPSAWRGASARCTSSSERAPTRLRPASENQYRA